MKYPTITGELAVLNAKFDRGDGKDIGTDDVLAVGTSRVFFLNNRDTCTPNPPISKLAMNFKLRTTWWLALFTNCKTKLDRRNSPFQDFSIVNLGLDWPKSLWQRQWCPLLMGLYSSRRWSRRTSQENVSIRVLREFVGLYQLRQDFENHFYWLVLD